MDMFSREFRRRTSPKRFVAALQSVLAIGGLTLMAGCAQFSPDGGMALVLEAAHRDLGKEVTALRTPEDALTSRAVVDRLLARTLTADAAVQIALLNNRGLQAAYNDLAVSEAVRIGESLPPNPTISLSRLASSAEIEIERQIVADVLALATLPTRSEIAGARFRQAQLRAVWETLRIAADTRRAYYRTVAGRDLTGFLTQAKDAAEATTKLAARLGQTGAMNKLDQAREQVFYADLTAQLAATQQRATSDREALIRTMGLWGEDLALRLPNFLPPLPKRPEALASIEVEAVRRRVDLQVSRLGIEALGKWYGLTQASRFINLLDAGNRDKVTQDRATGERIKSRGFDVQFQIPIFDFGEVRVREAEATYMGAVNRLLELAVNVRSEARDAYRNYRSAYDIANHYGREILPLRKIISEETQLRYNGMLIDVFALLAEARQRIAATTAAIEARREFWLASVNLSTAVVGGGTTSETTQTAVNASGAAKE